METLKKLSDQELIQAYIKGDENALQVLLGRYQSKIYTSISIQVKDDYLAEDIFQETFIKVINTLRAGKYNDEGKFLSWVMRIAHNIIIDHYRKEKRIPSVVNAEGFDIFDILPFEDDGVDTRIMKGQIDLDLRKIIQLLPDDQKEVLIMRHFCDMSFKDIALITEVSINTALGRMRYALANLRKMIEDHNMTMQIS